MSWVGRGVADWASIKTLFLLLVCDLQTIFSGTWKKTWGKSWTGEIITTFLRILCKFVPQNGNKRCRAYPYVARGVANWIGLLVVSCDVCNGWFTASIQAVLSLCLLPLYTVLSRKSLSSFFIPYLNFDRLFYTKLNYKTASILCVFYAPNQLFQRVYIPPPKVSRI